MTSRSPVSYLFLIFITGFAMLQACGDSKGKVALSDATPPLGGVIDTGGAAGGLTATGGNIGFGGSTAIACGDPGTPCCAGNSCTGGGCCVSGICMAPGGACTTVGGGLCRNGACGNCGGPGLPCCSSGLGLVCTSPGTTCSGVTCAKCGDLGTACCTSAGGAGSCNGAELMCSSGLCQKCGVPGGSCCAGNTCQSGCCYGGTCIGETTSCGAGNGTCSAGRCTGCGSAAQPCCGGLCYDKLLCMGNTCTSCGGPGEACCPAGGTTPQCQTGSACSGTGLTAVCSRCGILGNACCAGNVCNEGCCSAGLCIAGSCSISTGGSSGAGGVAGGGGTVIASQSLATGGSVTVGGSTFAGTAIIGGTVITGGISAGSGIGGTTTIGGTALVGGTSKVGSTVGGNTSTGGVPGTGGASTAGGKISGCGSPNTTSPCSKSGYMCSIDVNATRRAYYVQLPPSYNSSQRYPVVFQYHWFTSSATEALTKYGIDKSFPEAIYVTPQGLSLGSEGQGGWNNDPQDITFTKLMLADVQSKYCVDDARIFATGFSMGASMSHFVACELGEVFRAIAPISGIAANLSGCSALPIAMWSSHGISDGTYTIEKGREARDRIVKRDQCGTTTAAVNPSPCAKYQGCAQGYDVTWCEWKGGHEIPSFAFTAIADFFRQL